MSKRWGLALGGGGILGLAHLGVVEVLNNEGLQPHFIAGTSAGAIVGGLMAAGVDLSTAVKEISGVTWDREYGEISALATNGKIATKRVSGLLPGRLIELLLERLVGGTTVGEVTTPLAIPAVDVTGGNLVIFTNRPPAPGPSLYRHPQTGRLYCTDAPLSLAIRASISLPGVYTPKAYRGMSLVDGGILDVMPAYEVRRMGAQEVIAVDLGTHADKPQRAGDLVSVISRCFSLACRSSAKRSLEEHASLVLQPKIFEVGFPTRREVQDLIHAGRQAAAEALDKVLRIIL